MLDILFNRAMVVDGSGEPARIADVGVRGSRIVAVGATDEPAARIIDAEGLVLAPGFIDIHTHYDAQVAWDPVASPSSIHGVTTIIGGNCGFTVAPMRPQHIDYLSRMLSVVEGMPLTSLHQGMDWQWESFGEWLEHLDGRAGVNMGFLAGHSTLRRLVMGDDAVGSAASPQQLSAMCALLHHSLKEGALGFSSSWSSGHADANNNPVPSRFAQQDELYALAQATGEHEGTLLEFAPGLPGVFGDCEVDTMIGMSQRANRSINWNALRIQSDDASFIEEQLSYGARAQEAGADITVLAFPELSFFLVTLANPLLWSSIPGWEDLMKLPLDQRLEQFTRRDVRQSLRTHALNAQGSRSPALAALTRWESLRIAHTTRPANEDLVGRSVGNVARERGRDTFDALCDIAVADGLRTYFKLHFPEDDSGLLWERRAQVWERKHVILGASDAGAHVDLTCGPIYTTGLIGRSVRDRKLITMEKAVRLLTDAPARFYSIRDRGRIAPGWIADLVLFDAATIDYGPLHVRRDFPGGAERLYSDAVGIKSTFVNGRELIRDGAHTGDLPGTVLRSGRDTDTRRVRSATAA